MRCCGTSKRSLQLFPNHSRLRYRSAFCCSATVESRRLWKWLIKKMLKKPTKLFSCILAYIFCCFLCPSMKMNPLDAAIFDFDDDHSPMFAIKKCRREDYFGVFQLPGYKWMPFSFWSFQLSGLKWRKYCGVVNLRW